MKASVIYGHNSYLSIKRRMGWEKRYTEIDNNTGGPDDDQTEANAAPVVWGCTPG